MRTLVTLALAAVIACTFLVLRAQWRELVREHRARQAATAAPPARPEAPPARPSARTAPRPVRAGEALREPVPGNTDGGWLPWNGGDLYARDYSAQVRPESAGRF